MFLATLASAGARPFIARSPALRMAISASPPPTIAEYPSPALSPWDVVASQISALQAEDSEPTPTESANLAATSPAHTHTHASSSSACRAVAADVRTFRFASPECKRTTGKMKRMSVRCAPCTSPPPSSPPSPPPPPPPSPPPCTRHGEPALLCSQAASRPHATLSPLPSPAGAHLLCAALLLAAHVPRHAHLRAGGGVRTLLRASMGGARGGGGPMAAEALHV